MLKTKKQKQKYTKEIKQVSTDLHQQLFQEYCDHDGPRVCILGVYGKGNLGDEALLDTVSQDFSATIHNCHFMVICSDSCRVEADNEVLAFTRKPLKNFTKKIMALRQADLCVVGGGTLIYDQGSCTKNIAATIALIYWPFWAWVMRIPTVAYAQGLGPAKSMVTRFTIKYLLPIFSLVTLRDTDSYDLYRHIAGVTNEKIYVSCDSVVSSEKYFVDGETAKYLPQHTFINESPYIVVAFRQPQAGSAYLLNEWSRLIANCQKASGAKIVLLPIHLSDKYSDDRAAIESVAHSLKNLGIQGKFILRVKWEKLQEATWILQNARLVVSNRLHALLLALKAGVPVVGIGGTDKIKGCLSMVGVQTACNFIDQNNFNDEDGLKKIMAAFNATQQEKNKLIVDVANWVNKSPTNAEIIENNFNSINRKYAKNELTK